MPSSKLQGLWVKYFPFGGRGELLPLAACSEFTNHCFPPTFPFLLSEPHDNSLSASSGPEGFYKKEKFSLGGEGPVHSIHCSWDVLLKLHPSRTQKNFLVLSFLSLESFCSHWGSIFTCFMFSQSLFWNLREKKLSFFQQKRTSTDDVFCQIKTKLQYIFFSRFT